MSYVSDWSPNSKPQASPRKLSRLLSALRHAVEREACERSLHEFVKHAWAVIEPGEAFIDGRHIKLICRELELVSYGKTRDLLINVPPGHMKSLLVCVFWPAWEWTWRPTRRFLCAAYADDLAVRDSLKCRQIVESDWYQGHWGNKVQPSPSQWAKDSWQNTLFGGRVCISVGSKGTGFGGHHLLLDDPHNAAEVHWDVKRAAVPRWWREVWSSRMRPPAAGGRVTIMQRLHTGDLSGYLLGQGRVKHICLPAEFDPIHPHLCPQDWRKTPGELLWPQMFNRNELTRLQEDLETEFARAGQLQQRPVPAGGGIIKEKWWQLWEQKETPRCDIKIMSVDTAFTEKTSNDYSAVSVWGRFYDEHDRSSLILLYAWRGRLEFPELIVKLEEIAKKHLRKASATRVLVEQQAAGMPVMQELRRRVNFPITKFDPRRYGDKTARAYAVQSIFEGGIIWAPAMNFSAMVIEECAVFPNGDHDDLVDTVTMALLHLRGAGIALRTDERDRGLIARRTPKKSERPIYGQIKSGD